MKPLRIGTRTSKLALWQTEHVLATLRVHHPDLSVEVVPISTHGDREKNIPLPELGIKGAFTLALETALLAGDLDLAVHSLKDMPTDLPPNLMIGAILPREDARDVLVSPLGKPLAQLPKGAVIGTSSLRRQAQLLALRPDLQIRSIRGNIDGRLQALASGDFDAIVLAAAGLIRLARLEWVTEWFDLSQFIAAPGQGALAVQCRTTDMTLRNTLACIHHAPTARAVQAERTFLQALGGTCSNPISAYATAHETRDEVTLHTRISALDGTDWVENLATSSNPSALGLALAEAALARGAGKWITKR